MADNIDFTDVLNMSVLGDKLKEARENKGITIGQANKQTHIHSTVLKALEDGNCENILNHTYVKSFLKKYSDYLGLDSSRVMREYLRLRPETRSEISTKVPETKDVSGPASRALPVIRFLATGIIVIGLVFFIGSRIYFYLKKPGPARRVTAGAIGKKASANVRSSKKVPSEKLRPSSKLSVTSVPKNIPLNLLLKVNKDVFVKIRTDGNLIFQHLLTKGTAEVFKADSSINIYIANGESVELIVNGKPLGPLGKGPQEDIEITRSGVKLK